MQAGHRLIRRQPARVQNLTARMAGDLRSRLGKATVTVNRGGLPARSRHISNVRPAGIPVGRRTGRKPRAATPGPHTLWANAASGEATAPRALPQRAKPLVELLSAAAASDEPVPTTPFPSLSEPFDILPTGADDVAQPRPAVDDPGGGQLDAANLDHLRACAEAWSA